jgi:hypothetical protein
MTFETPGDDGLPTDTLAVAEDMCRDAVQQLYVTLRLVRAGKLQEARATFQAARDLRSALQVAVEEKIKIERIRKQEAGIVNAYAIDLAAARDEIGKRLARQRGEG